MIDAKLVILANTAQSGQSSPSTCQKKVTLKEPCKLAKKILVFWIAYFLLVFAGHSCHEIDSEISEQFESQEILLQFQCIAIVATAKDLRPDCTIEWQVHLECCWDPEQVKWESVQLLEMKVWSKASMLAPLHCSMLVTFPLLLPMARTSKLCI